MQKFTFNRFHSIIFLSSFLFLGEEYFLKGQTWVQLSDLPTSRSGSASFFIDDKMYISGGRNFGNSIFYSDLWAYDTSSGQWTQKASIAGGTFKFNAGIGFTINGKGYVGLGVDDLQNYKSELWEYDAVSDTWTQKASLPATGREGSACFVLNNKAYVIGGAAASRFAQVWEYDPAIDTWTLKGNFPDGPIISAVGFAINGKGYVACGYPGNSVSARTFEYSPLSNQWVLKANFAGNARQELSAFVLNGKAYCGLGRGNTFGATYSDFYCFDPLLNIWTVEGNFPGAPRFSAISGGLGSKAYVGSGWSDLKDFYEFTPKFTPNEPDLIFEKSYSDQLSFFPVPAKEHLFVKGVSFELPVKFSIFDTKGRLVRSGFVEKNSRIDCSGLQKGNYLIELMTAGKTFKRNVIIEE